MIKQNKTKQTLQLFYSFPSFLSSSSLCVCYHGHYVF